MLVSGGGNVVNVVLWVLIDVMGRGNGVKIC